MQRFEYRHQHHQRLRSLTKRGDGHPVNGVRHQPTMHRRQYQRNR
ncbi:Uncharacterised protein [Vibrio cholerae]|nr:Uncharacterised protein [Vibrio cholerae]CSI84056.1 Uncharacterised protein [Vibrio cholerae]